MPAALDPKQMAEIIDRLFVVFRDRGYEGASLADLSAATGLGKSSLYHHFPRGKQQMAEAVLERARAFLQAAVVDVARSPDPLRTRVHRIVASMDQLYASGENSCVLGKLAVSQIGPAGRLIASELFETWTDAIALLAHESGMSHSKARHFASDWIAQVQGSLILHAANGDPRPFERAMAQLSDIARSPAPRKTLRA